MNGNITYEAWQKLSVDFDQLRYPLMVLQQALKQEELYHIEAVVDCIMERAHQLHSYIQDDLKTVSEAGKFERG